MPANWSSLVSNIKARRCIPFLGAGACDGVLPKGSELAASLLAPSGSLRPFPFPGDEHNLAKVAQVAAALNGDALVLKRSVADLMNATIRPSGGPAVSPPNIHAALARLKLPLYLTTNYDTLLEDALSGAGVPYVSEICRWNNELLENVESAFEGETLADPTEAQSVVFHLHGRLDMPDSLVLTEDDYLDFLLNIARDVAGKPEGRASKAVLPYVLRKLIKNRPLIFIGYGLSDVNFLVILRGLLRTVEPSGRVQRVAVWLDPDTSIPKGGDPEEIKSRIETYFRWTLSLEVFWGTAERFATDLATALAAS